MYHFFDLGCYRKHNGSVLFLLEVFSLKNEGVIAVFPQNKVYDVIRPEVRRSSTEMEPFCSHTFGHYFSFYMKSLVQKLTEKMRSL